MYIRWQTYNVDYFFIVLIEILSMIKLNNVSLVYNENLRNTHAISNINLEIDKSDFIVVLGPSRCEKSSLLKLIAGFIKPSSGQVLKKILKYQVQEMTEA